MDDTKRSNVQTRALILSKTLKRRDDVRIRRIVENFAGELNYLEQGLEELAISSEAWACVRLLDVRPKMVFAHPELLQQHPETLLYYRRIATLSLKQ